MQSLAQNSGGHAFHGVSNVQEREILQQREYIDQIDRQIMELINQRALHALAIGRCKEATGRPEFSPERESLLLRKLIAGNRGPISDSGLKQIYAEIVSACRAVQRPLRVAFLGPEATFSHQAARQHFGSSCDFAPLATIVDVFEEVSRGHAQVGVVPVENSSEGGVSVTLDQFLGSDLAVCGEIYSKVRQMLMSRETGLDQIKKVYSHPQALNQCRGWLRRNLPQAVLVESSSTAAAARQAAGEPGAAAVGSEMTAGHYGLPVLAADIQDNPHNMTRFFVLGRQSCPATGADKTSILYLAAHQPGSLYGSLAHFAERGINMTRIESRPAKNRPWEYAFFLDCEGHQDEEPLRAALAALTSEVPQVRVLGSYPAGDPGLAV
ncbi:MAG: prephenate dehydratase [Pseudomonadota bacterium]